MKRRLYSTVALMIVTVLALGVGAVSHVAATTIVSSYYNGNGHGGVTFNLNTKLTFNGYSTNWNTTYAESYIKVTNGGSANCDRNRLFEQSWTEFSNKNYAGTPFPFSNDGLYHYDYFNHDGRVSLWGLRSWWQVDDTFSGVVCSYGGGAGVTQASNSASSASEIVASP